MAWSREEIFTLPNIIDVQSGPMRKSASPTVVFLGRLDPYKRPWIAVELARRFPEVTFLFLGQTHFRGAGSWTPSRPSPERQAPRPYRWRRERGDPLRGLGTREHLDPRRLGRELPRGPRVEDPDPELPGPGGRRVAVRRLRGPLGRNGPRGASGLRRAALRLLLDDTALRERLGDEGRQWVAATHSRLALPGSLRRSLPAGRDSDLGSAQRSGPDSYSPSPASGGGRNETPGGGTYVEPASPSPTRASSAAKTPLHGGADPLARKPCEPRTRSFESRADHRLDEPAPRRTAKRDQRILAESAANVGEPPPPLPRERPPGPDSKLLVGEEIPAIGAPGGALRPAEKPLHDEDEVAVPPA